MWAIAEITPDGEIVAYMKGRSVIHRDGNEVLQDRWTAERDHACMYLSEEDAMRIANDIALYRRLNAMPANFEVFRI